MGRGETISRLHSKAASANRRPGKDAALTDRLWLERLEGTSCRGGEVLSGKCEVKSGTGRNRPPNAGRKEGATTGTACGPYRSRISRRRPGEEWIVCVGKFERGGVFWQTGRQASRLLCTESRKPHATLEPTADFAPHRLRRRATSSENGVGGRTGTRIGRRIGRRAAGPIEGRDCFRNRGIEVAGNRFAAADHAESRAGRPSLNLAGIGDPDPAHAAREEVFLTGISRQTGGLTARCDSP